MKTKNRSFLVVFIILMVSAVSAVAHYGMIIPSDSMLMQKESKNILLTISFSHPFEGIGMNQVKPKVFTVIANGKKKDLLDGLKPTIVMNHSAWSMDYRIKRPGIYVFCMEPEPYWEPAEDCFIIHYTKTVVAAFGFDDGWDKNAGLKTEIVPLSKPFGLYTGNVFQGVVFKDNKPVPFAEVEVEYYNKDKKAVAPTDYMITQAIKADQNGVFTYGVPHAGWWGFAALTTADYKLKYQGKEKDVEQGAVIWVRFHDWKTK